MTTLLLLVAVVSARFPTPFRVPSSPESVDFYVGPRRSWWYP